MESSRYKYGLTLVEMLVVVAVIMLLAGLTIGIGSHLDTQSKERAVRSTFELLGTALQEYYDFWGAFPVADAADPRVNCETLYAELDFLPACRELLGQISEKLIRDEFTPPDPAARPGVYEIYDPWQVNDDQSRRVLDYRYVDDDAFPELRSAGPDRLFNTPDDVTSR